MTTKRKRIPARAAGLALMAVALVLPASAFANTNEPIAQTGGMTVMIPMLGTSLTVAVTLDQVGHISGVTLDPSGALPTTTTGEHSVKFTNAEGTATVDVRARGDKLQVKARTKLADLVGSGTWSANVFGAGTGANVAYTIGVDGDGKPTLKVSSATAPAGVGVVVKDPAGAHDGKGDRHGTASARAVVVFSWHGFLKRLTLSVSARENGAASFKVSLSGRDRQKVQGTLAELTGDRLWSAHLCDTTPVSVAYHVTTDGTVVVDSTAGAPATVKDARHGVRVRFDGTRVGLSVRLKAVGGGLWSLKVSGQSGRCGGDDDHDRHDKDSKGDKHHDDGDDHGDRNGHDGNGDGDRQGGGDHGSDGN